MQPIEIITISPTQLQKTIVEALRKYDQEKQSKEDITGTVSINQAAKILNVAHATVKKLIATGELKTTADQRRIPKKALNEYLQTT